MQGILRPFTRNEVELYHDWLADQSVLGPFVETEHTSLEELLERFDLTGWDNPQETYRIYESMSGDKLGYAHWWKCDKYEPHIEFGRVLLPPYRGKGLGTGFLLDILETIFAGCDTDRIQAITAVDNQVVLHQWQQVGIQVEGTLRQFMTLRGAHVDCKIGSILRDEWQEASVKRLRNGK